MRITKEYIEDLYYKQQLSQRQIASILKTSQMQVRRIMKRLNVVSRPHGSQYMPVPKGSHLSEKHKQAIAESKKKIQVDYVQLNSISYRIKNEITYLKLSRGEESLIDKEDLEHVSYYYWNATPHIMNGFYAMTKKDKKTVYLHRFIMNAPTGKYVDHINHNTLDNRKSNLQIVTNQENTSKHEKAYNTSKLGIRGVSIQKTNNKNKLQLYVFRCHDTRHKLCKYFPLTETGLEQAKKLSLEHHFS